MPVRIDETKPYFSIGAVAEILHIKPRMLRLYEERGLITPSRTEGNRRLYSLRDIDMLAYIQYLTCVKRVNIAGVIEIQKLLGKMDQETRKSLIEEVHRRIESLPQEEKKAYSGENDEVSHVVIQEAAHFSRKQKNLSQ